jgi:hypothetical protein
MKDSIMWIVGILDVNCFFQLVASERALEGVELA